MICPTSPHSEKKIAVNPADAPRGNEPTMTGVVAAVIGFLRHRTTAIARNVTVLVTAMSRSGSDAMKPPKRTATTVFAMNATEAPASTDETRYRVASAPSVYSVLSKKPKLSKKERNAANAPNRRVVAFFFREGLEIKPSDWPCPKWNESSAKCVERQWTDHEERLKPEEEDLFREYKLTRNTMACRFYDRLARRSPCEAGFKEWVLRLFVPKKPPPPKEQQPGDGKKEGAPPSDEATAENEAESPWKDKAPLAGAEFTLTGAAQDIKGFTDANGFLRARVAADVVELTLTIVGHVIKLKGGALKELDDPDFGDTRAVQERLFNLAYGPARRELWTANDVKAAINEFRKDFGLPDGAVDDALKEKLREVHGC